MKLASWIGQSNNSSKTLTGILIFAVIHNGKATPPPTSYHIDSPASESVVLSFGSRGQLKKMDTMICDEHIWESTNVLLF